MGGVVMRRMIALFKIVALAIMLTLLNNSMQIVGNINRFLFVPHVDYAFFYSESELFDKAELIVLGSVETILAQDSPLNNKYTSDIVTVSPFRVDKVLHGSYDKEYLYVLQPFVIDEDERGYKRKRGLGYYKELDRQNMYILYLTNVKRFLSINIYYHGELVTDVYSIHSLYHGMVNLTEDIVPGEYRWLGEKAWREQQGNFIERIQTIKAGAISRFWDEIQDYIK